MASKYLQRYPIPQHFPEALHDFTREILRLQPGNILEFSVKYFQAKEKNEPLVWNDPNPRKPKPSDYKVKPPESASTSSAEKFSRQRPQTNETSIPQSSESLTHKASQAQKPKGQKYSRPEIEQDLKNQKKEAENSAQKYLNDLTEKVSSRVSDGEDM